jgi:uncharacterized protein YebE (UPF0316 family)
MSKTLLVLLVVVLKFLNEGVDSYSECGIMSSSSGLIQNGKFSSRKEFPWMASINDHASLYNSSGALISRKHVVTRATVVGYWNDDKTKRIAIETSRFKIYLGSLQHVSDQNIFNAQEIILHPNIKLVDEVPTNDIAIIVLSTSVEFSDFIRPVCLWTFSDDLNLIKNLPIYAVGYGNDENGIVSNVRKHAKVTLMNQNECEENYSFAKTFFIENKSFCVIGDENESPCKFDVILFVKFNGKWYLRGIFLRRFAYPNKSCPVGPSHPFLYHDVATNIKWIENMKSYDECGIMSSSSGLIQKGKFSSRTDFPWMASIVDSQDFNSSGALISRKHVLTRAAVVGGWNDDKTKFTAIEKSRFKIYLGSLQHVSDQNIFNGQEIILHPNIKEIDKTETNDIAIIVLSSSVKFSDFIRPVCLWTFGDNLNLIQNLPIYAVGYGRDENGIVSNVRKHAKVTLMNHNDCEEKYSFAKTFFNKNKSFCVIGDKNESPCLFDGCLFVKFNGKWYLRGILLRMFTYSNGSCAVGSSYPFLYHDIAKNIKWIETIVEN